MNEAQFRLLMEGLDVLRRQLIDIEVAIIRKREAALYCDVTGCNDEGKYMVCDNHFISAQRGRWV